MGDRRIPWTCIDLDWPMVVCILVNVCILGEPFDFLEDNEYTHTHTHTHVSLMVLSLCVICRGTRTNGLEYQLSLPTQKKLERLGPPRHMALRETKS